MVAPPFGSSDVSPSVSVYRKERSAALRPRLAAGLPFSSGAEALARGQKVQHRELVRRAYSGPFLGLGVPERAHCAATHTVPESTHFAVGRKDVGWIGRASGNFH